MAATNAELRAALKVLVGMFKVEPIKGKTVDLLWHVTGEGEKASSVCLCNGANSYQIASIRMIKEALERTEQIINKK